MTNVFGAVIHNKVSGFLKILSKDVLDFAVANGQIFDRSGIKDFFQNQEDFLSVKNTISSDHYNEKADRTEYGDFQTNATLALNVTEHLRSNHANPEIVIEPTCGKGAFIIAALRSFREIKKIFAIEIYKPYVWEAKFNILEFAIDHPSHPRSEITIYHSNIFDLEFDNIASQCFSKEILVIGNPPWITNSQLGTLESANLPTKSNFKNHSGLDAITGKGNFDIGESISEAKKVMEEAVPMGTMQDVHYYGRQLLNMKQVDEAFKVFKSNYDKFPNQFTTNVGMGRIYSAKSDYKKAMTFMKAALPQAPNEMNKQSVESMIKKLEEGKDVN